MVKNEQDQSAVVEALESMAEAEGRECSAFDLKIPDLSHELDALAEIDRIVLERWELLHSPVQAFTYATDPEFHGHLKNLEADGEVMEGFEEVLKRVLADQPHLAQTGMEPRSLPISGPRTSGLTMSYGVVYGFVSDHVLQLLSCYSSNTTGIWLWWVG